MDLFSGAELAFGNTYFTPRPSHLLKIHTDLPVKTLISAEVPPSAGSFLFSQRGLQNRFILWRADGSNLYLDEYSIDRDLIDPSLCINFSQSLIIPGTRIFIVRHKTFLLVVPTQSGIHRFYLPMERDQNDSLGNLSLLSRIHQSGELSANHDFYIWKYAGIATKISTGIDKNGQTLVAACMTDKQLLRIVFPSLGSITNEMIAEENVVQGTGVINRFFMKQNIETWDMVVAIDAQGELRIFNLCRDGKIRVYNIKTQNLLACVDLTELIPTWSRQIVDVALKSIIIDKGYADLLLIHIVAAGESHFIVLKQILDKLAILFSTTLEDIYIKDFTCTVKDREADEYCLWVIVNESPEGWNLDEENGQPYTFKKCEFRINKNDYAAWEIIRPASSSSAVDSFLYKYPNMEEVRNRVFDGNNYSFDVVNRAVQVVCKQTIKQVDYGNWLSLSRHLDEFLSSVQFKQLYLSNNRDDEDTFLDYSTSHDDTNLKHAYEKFWSNFLKTCNQLQEEHLTPLAIWHASRLGLVGVIQMCRFTVYMPSDEHMRLVSDPKNRVVKQFFHLIRSNMNANIKDPDKTLELVNNNKDELGRLIVSYTSNASPPITTFKLIKCSGSQYLNSSFTIGFLAMALRTIILVRHKIAWIICNLIDVVPQILAISSEARVNPKLDMVISANKTRIMQLINYYSTLWSALSVRLISHESIPKQINVAQAFLKYGAHEMIKRLSKNQQNVTIKTLEIQNEEDEFGEELEDDTFDEEWDGDELLDMMENEGNIENSTIKLETRASPSRWEKTQLQRVRERRTRFNQFFVELLDGILCVLWPESHTLALPRFLAESKFFDALKNYCTLNEPYPKQLEFSFRFLFAIALSGLGQTSEAWEIFQEVAQGVVKRDEVLNMLLSSMYPSPSVNLLSQKSGKMQDNNDISMQFREHTLVEYFNKVMLVFKEHTRAETEYAKYIVLAGELAIKCAKEASTTGEDNLLLSEIYTTLFTQHLVSKNYLNAVHTILLNPNEKRQSVCLRQLIIHLLDTRKTQILVALPYDHLVNTVVEILEARCKAETINSTNSGMTTMYNIAYAFHISRCEYIKAAKLMYELSIRLRHEIQNRTMLQRRCNALATVYQTMQIAELEMDTFICDIESETSENMTEPIVSTVSDNGIDYDFAMVELNELDTSQDSHSCRYAVQIKLTDVARELLKVEARLALIDADPMLVPPLAENDILRESLKHRRYDMAWLLIKEFELKPYDLLEKITEEAIRIDYESTEEHDRRELDPDQHIEPEWVMCNRNFIRDCNTIGSHQKSHWRIVISYLDLAMKLFPHDTVILRTVANAFLKYTIKLPSWLVQRYTHSNFGDLLRTFLDYGDLEDAFKLLITQIDKRKQRVKEIVTRQICTDPIAKTISLQEELGLLLPYTHIEILLQMAEVSEERNKLPISETLDKLREFTNYQRSLMHNPIA